MMKTKAYIVYLVSHVLYIKKGT